MVALGVEQFHADRDIVLLGKPDVLLDGNFAVVHSFVVIHPRTVAGKTDHVGKARLGGFFNGLDADHRVCGRGTQHAS